MIALGHPVYLGMIYYVRLQLRHWWRLTQTVCVLYYCWFHDVHTQACIRVGLVPLYLGWWRSLNWTIVVLLRYSQASSFRLGKIVIRQHVVTCRACLALWIHIHQSIVSHLRILLLAYLRWKVLSVTAATVADRLRNEIVHSGIVANWDLHHCNLVWFCLNWKLENFNRDDASCISSTFTIVSHVQIVQLLLVELIKILLDLLLVTG